MGQVEPRDEYAVGRVIHDGLVGRVVLGEHDVQVVGVEAGIVSRQNEGDAEQSDQVDGPVMQLTCHFSCVGQRQVSDTRQHLLHVSPEWTSSPSDRCSGQHADHRTQNDEEKHDEVGLSREHEVIGCALTGKYLRLVLDCQDVRCV